MAPGWWMQPREDALRKRRWVSSHDGNMGTDGCNMTTMPLKKRPKRSVEDRRVARRKRNTAAVRRFRERVHQREEEIKSGIFQNQQRLETLEATIGQLLDVLKDGPSSTATIGAGKKDRMTLELHKGATIPEAGATCRPDSTTRRDSSQVIELTSHQDSALRQKSASWRESMLHQAITSRPESGRRSTYQLTHCKASSSLKEEMPAKGTTATATTTARKESNALKEATPCKQSNGKLALASLLC